MHDVVILQEMIYVWNGFAIIGRNPDLLESMSQLIEASINSLTQQKGKSTGVYCIYIVVGGLYQWLSNIDMLVSVIVFIIYSAVLLIQVLLINKSC